MLLGYSLWKKKPEYVFLAAAKVGGIGGNSDYPADFHLSEPDDTIKCNSFGIPFGVKNLYF